MSPSRPGLAYSDKGMHKRAYGKSKSCMSSRTIKAIIRKKPISFLVIILEGVIIAKSDQGTYPDINAKRDFSKRLKGFSETPTSSLSSSLSSNSSMATEWCDWAAPFAVISATDKKFDVDIFEKNRLVSGLFICSREDCIIRHGSSSVCIYTHLSHCSIEKNSWHLLNQIRL